jgi:hypothetical protein
MSPETVLMIADTEQWLLQPELKAIKEGLTYVDKKDLSKFDSEATYRGYLNWYG